MATGTAQSEQSTTTRGAEQAAQRDCYIETQLARTRRQVKLVDLAGGLMLLASGVLTCLLMLVLVDHWLFPLGVAGRALALAALLGGCGYYLAMWLPSLLLRRVNPVYAAQAIEQSQPTLKNSLINFLLFRSHRGVIHQPVYEALQQRAASDLARVPLDSAVDRSKLIKLGYLLLGVLIVCALYQVLSPKDPLQTVERVVLPWADIDRPGRVQIEDVRAIVRGAPDKHLGLSSQADGNLTVFYSQSIVVSALVKGLGDQEPVTLYYTTADKQTLDRAVPMYLSTETRRLECLLPPDDEGVQQPLQYRIEAGDAVTKNYRVKVRSAPSLVVQKIEYRYPDYTNRPSQTVLNDGDIHALEGTRVTVFARANRPIKAAYLEFDVDPAAAGQHMRKAMQAVDSNNARVSFTLRLKTDRRTPQHASYQLHFVTLGGQRSGQPIQHLIEVTPDLPPRIDILTPEKRTVDVPENGEQMIEVRAVDPDYALRRISLRTNSGHEAVLLDVPRGHPGQAVRQYRFVPRKLKLHEGDEVEYWAIAEDNRTAPPSGQPEPNVTRTQPNYRIRIVAPQRGKGQQQGPRDGSGQPPDQKSQPQQHDKDQEQDQEGEKEKDGQKGEEGNNAGSATQDGSQSKKQQDPSEGQSQKNGKQGDPSSDDPQQGKGQPGHEEQSQDKQAQPSENRDPGSGGAAGDKSSQDAADKRPLDPGGADDRQIIDAVNEHRQQDGEQKGQSPPKGDSAGEGKSPQDAGAKAGPERGNDGQAKGQRPDTTQPGNKQSGGGEPGDADRSNSQSDESTAKDDSLKLPSKQDGTSGKPQGGDKTIAEKKQTDQDKQPDDSSGGLGDSGESGAGQKGDEGQGSPEPQGDNRLRSKNQQPQDGQPENGESQEGKSPSGSPRQSVSEGAQEGDRSGGGKSGGGQPAKQKGHDSAGSSSAGDEGAGAAKESGAGETSKRAGDDQKANGKTGKSGTEPGKGTRAKPQPSAEKNPGKPQPSPEKPQPSDAKPDPHKQSDPSRATGGGGNSTGGGGKPGQTTPPQNTPPENSTGGDEPNLEYSRQATDLALEYLKDQQDDPDRKLLDKLGWTQADLKQFLDRWQQMNRAAAREGAKGKQARQELDETLRSLGLRPSRDRLLGGSGRKDSQRGNRESGRVSNPPPQYLKQYKAYQKGTRRAAGK